RPAEPVVRPSVEASFPDDDIDGDSVGSSDVDTDVLAAARARALGQGGLGLGSGLSGGLPAGSVIKIEEQSLGAALADDDRFATLRSNRSSRSNNDDPASEERSGTLTRSSKTGRTGQLAEEGRPLERSPSRKSTSKRSASVRRPARDARDDPPRGRSPLTPSPTPDIPPPPGYTIHLDPQSKDLQRSRSTRSTSGRDAEHSRDSLGRRSRDRDRDRQRGREESAERGTSKGRNRSSSRNRRSSSRRPTRSRDSSPDEDTIPISAVLHRQRSRGALGPSSSSNLTVPSSSHSRSASRVRSTRAGERQSPRPQSAADDENAPLASVALQALQQSLVAPSSRPTGGPTVSRSRSRNFRNEDDREREYRDRDRDRERRPRQQRGGETTDDDASEDVPLGNIQRSGSGSRQSRRTFGGGGDEDSMRSRQSTATEVVVID
ncbi:hypothetical protein HK104_001221, partial [Borealophlyctis nickersoniae]